MHVLIMSNRGVYDLVLKTGITNHQNTYLRKKCPTVRLSRSYIAWRRGKSGELTGQSQVRKSLRNCSSEKEGLMAGERPEQDAGKSLGESIQ